jgi:fatty acid desaturase
MSQLPPAHKRFLIYCHPKSSRPSITAASRQESPLIILGVILLIIGFIAHIAIVWTIGIIVVLAGLVLALLGMAGHAIGGRRHYF